MMESPVKDANKEKKSIQKGVKQNSIEDEKKDGYNSGHTHSIIKIEHQCIKLEQMKKSSIK